MKNNLIEWFNKLQKVEFFKKLGEYKIPPYLEEAIDKLLVDIQNSGRELSNKSVSFITESFSSVMHFLVGLLELLIIPVFVFYILMRK
jgi:predicted PurR-regulated permease PerM